jgi:hypothetical protein
MSRADEVLDLIDSALDDWAVGPDAMRSRPSFEHSGAETDSNAHSLRVPGTRRAVRGRTVHYNTGPGDPFETLRQLRSASDQDWANAVIRVTVEYYRAQVNEAREALQPAFEAARDAVRTAYRQFRADHWTLSPRPPQEPDPKAWTVFTEQPGRQKRPRRRDPDPRRVSVRRAPARTGRRP